MTCVGEGGIVLFFWSYRSNYVYVNFKIKEPRCKNREELDLVPKSWSRDNCETRSIRKRHVPTGHIVCCKHLQHRRWLIYGRRGEVWKVNTVGFYRRSVTVYSGLPVLVGVHFLVTRSRFVGKVLRRQLCGGVFRRLGPFQLTSQCQI